METSVVGAPSDPPPAVGAARIVSLLILVGVLATSTRFLVGSGLEVATFDGDAAELARRAPYLREDGGPVVEIRTPTRSFREAADADARYWLWALVPSLGLLTLLWERVALARAASRRRSLARRGAIARCALLGGVALAALMFTFTDGGAGWRPAVGALVAAGAALTLVACAGTEAVASHRRGWITTA